MFQNKTKQKLCWQCKSECSRCETISVIKLKLFFLRANNATMTSLLSCDSRKVISNVMSSTESVFFTIYIYNVSFVIKLKIKILFSTVSNTTS